MTDTDRSTTDSKAESPAIRSVLSFLSALGMLGAVHFVMLAERSDWPLLDTVVCAVLATTTVNLIIAAARRRG